MTVGERHVTYTPRAVSALGWEEVQGWRIKRYGVSALREVPPVRVQQVGREAVRRTLPAAYGDALSFGYSVVHEDEDGCYAVVGWWSRNRVILHTRTWLAEWHDLAALSEAPAHATACIWELVPMAHERSAWVRNVVRPAQPCLDAYLADTVAGMF
jgi:hypothetical protein